MLSQWGQYFILIFVGFGFVNARKTDSAGSFS